MQNTYVQLKSGPQLFVLNPLDFDNLTALHGFREKSFSLLKFFRGAEEGNPLENTEKREAIFFSTGENFNIILSSDIFKHN